MEQFFGLASGVVSVVGYAPYIRDILRGRCRPERASWLIWSIEYSLLFIAQWQAGATHSLWLIGMQTLCTITVCSLSLRRGEGGVTWQHGLAVGGAAIGLASWYMTRHAEAAILILVAVELIGIILTAVKAYKDPDSETFNLWAWAGGGGALGLLAVGLHAHYILYVYPAALMYMCFGVALIVLRGQRRAQSPLQPLAQHCEKCEVSGY